MILFFYVLAAILSAIALLRLVLEVRRINAYYVLLFAMILLTNLGYLAIATSNTVEEAILANKMCYFGAILLPMTMLFTVADMCKVKLPKALYIGLAIFGFITICGVFSIGYTDLYYSDVWIEQYHSITVLKRTYGPMHNFYTIFLAAEYLLFAGIVVHTMRTEKQVPKETVIILLIEFSTAAGIYAIEHLLHFKVDLIPFAYVALGFLHLYIIRRYQIYDISYGLSDYGTDVQKNGYLSFDTALRLMNCNELPKEIFPELRLVQYGSNFYKMTSDFYKNVYQWIDGMTVNFEGKEHEKQFVKNDRVYKFNVVRITGFRDEVLGYKMEIVDDTENNAKILDLEADNKSLDEASRTDAMTGLLNKGAAEGDIDAAMSPDTHGTFLMLDLDSFKLVNDLHGHDAGDKVLIKFSELLREITRPGDIIGRIGGDEFVIYYRGWQTDDSLHRNTVWLNDELLKYAKELLGEEMGVPLGCSVGAAFVPQCGHDYDTIKKKADKALYNVKQNGKHGVFIVKDSGENETAGASEGEDAMQLSGIRTTLGERNEIPGPLEVSYDNIPTVYRYLSRYYDSAATVGGIILFRLEGNFSEEDSDAFWNMLKNSLRREDLISQQQKGIYITILADTDYDASEVVAGKIMHAWEIIGTGIKATAEVQNI